MHSEEEAIDAIRRYVRGGEHSAADVESIVGEELFDGELDEDWLRAEVRREFARHRKEDEILACRHGKAALEAEGLSVEWDGSVKSRLLVAMTWQRRG